MFGDDFLTSPSGFVVYGELLVIAELNARLTICGADDRPITYLGDNGAVADVAGWPNNHNERGESVRTALLEPGKFNSPHGMAVDAEGNLYVAEWLIGGGRGVSGGGWPRACRRCTESQRVVAAPTSKDHLSSDEVSYGQAFTSVMSSTRLPRPSLGRPSA